MFYWIYDVPALWVIVLFEAVFVGVCWLGTLSSCAPLLSLGSARSRA